MPLPSFAAGLAIAPGALTFGGAVGGLASLDFEPAAAAPTPEFRSVAVSHGGAAQEARDASCGAAEGSEDATREL